ncbi:MAG TPA: FMN-binding protein [Candidatus Brocadiales bacterium]|nr:FMN-binding protein [Candidatus Brocadiales bacterium]
MNKKVQYTVVLLVICICAAAGLGSTFVLTKGKIQQREDEKRQMALTVVLPGLNGAPVEITPESTPVPDKVYKGNGKDKGVIGYAAMGEAQGYSSKLKVMVGVDPSANKVIAISILSQNETPGLGTKAVEIATNKTIWKALFGKKEIATSEEALVPWFQKQFKGKPLNQLIVVRDKDPEKISAITGATITTKAVVKAVEDAIGKIKNSVKDDKTYSTSAYLFLSEVQNDRH